jgi:hypothetical protein
MNDEREQGQTNDERVKDGRERGRERSKKDRETKRLEEKDD